MVMNSLKTKLHKLQKMKQFLKVRHYTTYVYGSYLFGKINFMLKFHISWIDDDERTTEALTEWAKENLISPFWGL